MIKRTAIILSILMAFSTAGFTMSEMDKIKYLLNEIEISGNSFIRNGSEYSSKKARVHLEYKLSRAGSYIKTAEAFIKRIASGSSFSGKPYYIKLKNGKIIRSKLWLMKRLRTLEEKKP